MVSPAQRFPEPDDPLSKSFSAPGTCPVHPSGTETIKDRGSRWESRDLQAGHPGRPFDQQPWKQISCRGLRGARPATGTIIVPLDRCIERYHPRPDRSTRLGATCQNAWTHRQTDKQASSNFFHRPPMGISRCLKHAKIYFASFNSGLQK